MCIILAVVQLPAQAFEIGVLRFEVHVTATLGDGHVLRCSGRRKRGLPHYRRRCFEIKVLPCKGSISQKATPGAPD